MGRIREKVRGGGAKNSSRRNGKGEKRTENRGKEIKEVPSEGEKEEEGPPFQIRRCDSGCLANFLHPLVKALSQASFPSSPTV